MNKISLFLIGITIGAVIWYYINHFPLLYAFLLFIILKTKVKK